MIAYKICRIQNGKFMSANQLLKGTNFDTEYSVGVKTVPHKGLLFCFDSLSKCKEYIGENYSKYNVVIFECECELSEKDYSMIAMLFFGYVNFDFEIFWGDSESYIKNSSHWCVEKPSGTLFANSITLLRIVE
jgi:hypothetical protein